MSFLLIQNVNFDGVKLEENAVDLLAVRKHHTRSLVENKIASYIILAYSERAREGKFILKK